VAGWLAGRPAFGWLAGWPVCLLAGWLAGRPAFGWLASRRQASLPKTALLIASGVVCNSLLNHIFFFLNNKK